MSDEERRDYVVPWSCPKCGEANVDVGAAPASLASIGRYSRSCHACRKYDQVVRAPAGTEQDDIRSFPVRVWNGIQDGQLPELDDNEVLSLLRHSETNAKLYRAGRRAFVEEWKRRGLP